MACSRAPARLLSEASTQLLRSCRDGGIPSHPVDSGEFKRLPGWDHQLTMCNTEYFNVTWNKNGSVTIAIKVQFN